MLGLERERLVESVRRSMQCLIDQLSLGSEFGWSIVSRSVCYARFEAYSLPIGEQKNPKASFPPKIDLLYLVDSEVCPTMGVVMKQNDRGSRCCWSFSSPMSPSPTPDFSTSGHGSKQIEFSALLLL